MALPIIATPEFTTTIPSTKEKINFRPFLVKEEKILYIALEGGGNTEITSAVTKILESCILTPGINVKTLSSFDIEHLFLVLRGKSVGEAIELKIKHSEKVTDCDALNDVAINIDDIAVREDPDHTNVIDIGGDIGVTMKYPSIFSVGNNQATGTDIEKTFNLIADCVDSVYDKDKVYDDFTKTEIKEFVENLSKSQFESIMKFFETMPKLAHDVEFTCTECGQSDKMTVEGLQSFFT